MNLRGGIALIKKSLFSYTSSRGFFWTLAFGWMMGPVVYLFAWLVVAGQGQISGYGREDFIFYYLVLILVNQLTYPTSHWIVGENIQIGTLSNWLLRPLPVIYEAIAGDIAVKIVTMPFVILLTCSLGVFLRVKMSLSWPMVCLFIIGLIMAQILRFIFAYNLALLAFWTQRIDSLLAINDTLIFLFAGQVAPIALLPDLIRQIAQILPFRYMLGFPIEILNSTLNPSELIIGLSLQFIWVVSMFLLHKMIWCKGIRQYTAIGG